MSCVNLPDGTTKTQEDLLRELLGEERAFDGHTALYGGALEISQSDMKRLANKTKQAVEISIHSEGEVVTLRDGTQYRMTRDGWRKLAP